MNPTVEEEEDDGLQFSLPHITAIYSSKPSLARPGTGPISSTPALIETPKTANAPEVTSRAVSKEATAEVRAKAVFTVSEINGTDPEASSKVATKTVEHEQVRHSSDEHF